MNAHAPAPLKLFLPLLVFGSLLLASSLHATEAPQVLVPADIEDFTARVSSGFGVHVETQGDLMVVAAPNAFAVYVYALRDGAWQNVAKLAEENGAVIGFGADVALDGNLIAVSAPGASVSGIPGAGAIFVYAGDALSGWTQAARLVATNPISGAGLGDDLVVDAGRVAATTAGANGTAYLFEHDAASNTWNEAMQSAGIATAVGERAAVDVSVDTLAHLQWPGNVLIYENDESGWLLKTQLEVPSNSPGIALEDDVLAVAMPDGGIEPESGEGLVHIHERGIGDWGRTVILNAPDPSPADRFGNRFGSGLDLQDGVLVVEQGLETGLVDVFSKDESGAWRPFLEVRVSSAASEFSAAVSALTLAAGIPGDAVVKAYDLVTLMLQAADDSSAVVGTSSDPDATISGIAYTDNGSDRSAVDDDSLEDPDAIEDDSDAGSIIDATDNDGLDVDAIVDDSDAGSIIDATDNEGPDADAIEDDSDAGSIIDTTGPDNTSDGSDFNGDGASGEGGDANDDSATTTASVALPARNGEDSGGGSPGWEFALMMLLALRRRKARP